MTSVEDYQYLNETEHVRHRPDTFVGSIKNTTEERWTIELSERTEEGTEGKPVAKRSEIRYNPGLEQIILSLS